MATRAGRRWWKQYLITPAWEKVRLQVIRRDRECVVCGRKDIALEAHHEKYVDVGTPWESDDCVSLCRPHHKGIHKTLKYLKWKK